MYGKHGVRKADTVFRLNATECNVSMLHALPLSEMQVALSEIWRDLLRVEEVSSDHNFFALGGDSLAALTLIETVSERFSVELPTVTFLQCPTLERMAQLVTSLLEAHSENAELSGVQRGSEHDIQAAQSIGSGKSEPQELAMFAHGAPAPLVELSARDMLYIVLSVPGGAANIEDVYPLAPLQEGILFDYLNNSDGSDAYLLPILLQVPSKERLEKVVQAFREEVGRYDVLRTAILWERLPRPVQVVYRRASINLETMTLDAAREAGVQIEEMLQNEKQRLDLRAAPLLRLRAASHSRQSVWYLLLQWHHIVIDHVALALIVENVVERLRGGDVARSEVQPYRKHVEWALACARSGLAEKYFGEMLADVNWSTAPFGVRDLGEDGVNEACHVLGAVLSGRIRDQARRLAVGVAGLFHVGCAMVVAATTGLNDVVIGSVLLGRMGDNAGTARSVGLFINTLPLRLRLANISLHDFVRRVQHDLIELLNHEQASLAAVQRCSGVRWPMPLFTVILNYRHQVFGDDGAWGDLRQMRLRHAHRRTPYPILIEVDGRANVYALSAQTDRRIDAAEVLRLLAVTMQRLVSALERTPETTALELIKGGRE